MGVEETKEDERGTAKSWEDKEGWGGVQRGAQFEEPNEQNVQREKARGKTKKQPASEVQVESCCFFQWAVNCSTAQGQGREVLLQVLSQLLIKSFMHSVAWGEDPGLIGRMGHTYITGPITANSWRRLGLQSAKASMCPHPDFLCLSISTLEQRGEQRVLGPRAVLFPFKRHLLSVKQDSICVDQGPGAEKRDTHSH